MADSVMLDINWKMYSPEQRTMLEEAFRDRGFEVRPPDTARFSGELLNAIVLVMAEESVRESFRYAFEHLHALKHVLASTVFKPRTDCSETAIEVKTSNSTATLVTRDEYGLDDAYALMGDLAAAVEAHGHSNNLALSYKNGQWYVQTRIDGALYHFDTATRGLIRIDPTQAAALLLRGE